MEKVYYINSFLYFSGKLILSSVIYIPITRHVSFVDNIMAYKYEKILTSLKNAQISFFGKSLLYK
jgi:hypothetical protein